MPDILQREAIYLWFYFDIQLRQIFWYWVWGILLGSAISVFAKKWIHGAAEFLGRKIPGTVGICFASALGVPLLAARVVSCFACGVAAGLLVRLFFCAKDAPLYFDFTSFGDPREKDTDRNIFLRYAKNVLRNVRATGLWFLLGIFLSAVFQRYVSGDFVARLFERNEGFGVLMAATVGVPLYVCGGGTIPLLLQWVADGMSAGSAVAFMITGPATKITNLGALKIALGMKHFALYILFVMAFSFCTGILVNLIL